MSETTEPSKPVPPADRERLTVPVTAASRAEVPKTTKRSEKSPERRWGTGKTIATVTALNAAACGLAATILFWPQEREETLEIGINCPGNASNAELKSYSRSGDLARFVIGCSNGDTTAKPEGYNINDPDTTNPVLSVKVDVSDRFIERIGDDNSPYIQTRTAPEMSAESEVIINNVKGLNSWSIQ